MPAVHLQRVTHSYSPACETLLAASAHFDVGWTGIVGPNGAGKSTLLALVARELEPDDGRVRWDPEGVRPVLCPQAVETLTSFIQAFGDSRDGEARRWQGRLRLDPEHLGRWSELSPGERKRWQIGAALAARPEILLLDEPTNHLDVEGRDLLLRALREHRGVGLVVSHDRSLLDALTSQTLRVFAGRLESWAGGYSAARRAWRAAAEQAETQRASMRTDQRKLERRLAEQRRTLEKKGAAFRRRLRKASPKDHDARSVGNKIRHEAGAKAASRRLETGRAAAERKAGQLASMDVDRDFGRSLFFDYEACRRTRLLSHEGPLRAGGRTLAEGLSVELLRDDRVHLAGPNGAGKTTLLKTLVEHSELPEDKLLMLPQELDAAATRALLERLRTLPGDRRGRVLSLVAALGVDPERLLATARPSPGEVRKLAMAFGLGLGAWCLVLDEPTNHLDLPSVERLEAALAAFPGALLLVCHDERFVRRTTSRRWVLAEGRLRSESSR